MPEPAEFSLDPALIHRRFAATANMARQNDFVAREISSRMAERLDYIRLEPETILDLGCGHGADLPMLAQRYPQARRIGLDITPQLLQQARPAGGFLQRLLPQRNAPALVCADACALPLASRSVQLVWSNLLLSCLTDPADVFRESHRVLGVGGLLMFSTLGPDTLRELREAFADTAGRHIHRFIDMHDLGDALVKAGFSDPVMDMQSITLTYADAPSLFGELKSCAANNASALRPRGLGSPRKLAAALERLERMRQDGRLPATLELVFGHAWKPEPKQIEDGRDIIRFRSRP